MSIKSVGTFLQYSLIFFRIMAPLLENRPFLLDGFYFRDSTDLFWDLNTALLGLESGHEPGHVSAAQPGLQVTLLHWRGGGHCLHTGVTLRGALNKVHKVK